MKVRTLPRWTSVGAAAVVVLVALVLWGRFHARAPSAPAAAVPAVTLATVRFGEYAVTLDEAGHVGAPAGTTTKVAFAIPGIVQLVDVRVGERVSAGQKLAQLDTQMLALQAQQARAQAAAAEADYGAGAVPEAKLRGAKANARAAQARASADAAQLARERRLYAAGVAALKDVQAAKSQLAADEAGAVVAQADVRTAASQPAAIGAQAAAAQAAAAAAQDAFAHGTLIAPIAGVVTAIYKRAGESEDGSTPVLAIGPPAQDVATLDVPGADAQQINVGDPVTLTVAGLDSPSRGRVSAVVPSVDPATQSATVVVSGVPPNALAGSAVQARLTVAHVDGLLVPQSALVQDPQTGRIVVFVRRRERDGSFTFAQRVVTVAHEDGTTAEIASGLARGERIAAQGAFSLLAPAGG